MDLLGRRFRPAIALTLLALVLASAVVAGTVPTIRLGWTAPGDDGNIGRASSYDGRYSTSKPDTTSPASFAAWWNASRQIPGFPVPRVAGSSDTVVVSQAGGFSSDSSYYFVVRAADEVPNWSLFSNVAFVKPVDVVPPAPITNVRILP